MIIYLFIFLAKTIEVAISTIRMVLITKGFKLAGSMIGFFEIALWLVVASNVLDQVKTDPIKGLMYALGFSIGCYLGSLLESKIAMGSILITAIVNDETSESVILKLRNKGLGVTTCSGQGINNEKKILYIAVQRRKIKNIQDFIVKEDPSAMVFSSEMRDIHGGFGVQSQIRIR